MIGDCNKSLFNIMSYVYTVFSQRDMFVLKIIETAAQIAALAESRKISAFLNREAGHTSVAQDE
jgi:hypothetical protein